MFTELTPREREFEESIKDLPCAERVRRRSKLSEADFIKAAEIISTQIKVKINNSLPLNVKVRRVSILSDENLAKGLKFLQGEKE